MYIYIYYVYLIICIYIYETGHRTHSPTGKTSLLAAVRCVNFAVHMSGKHSRIHIYKYGITL